MKKIDDDLEDTVDNGLDETEYLMLTDANKKALDDSIQELEAGKGTKVSFEDLWK